jgi:hypothetical protein
MLDLVVYGEVSSLLSQAPSYKGKNLYRIVQAVHLIVFKQTFQNQGPIL